MGWFVVAFLLVSSSHAFVYHTTATGQLVQQGRSRTECPIRSRHRQYRAKKRPPQVSARSPPEQEQEQEQEQGQGQEQEQEQERASRFHGGVSPSAPSTEDDHGEGVSITNKKRNGEEVAAAAANRSGRKLKPLSSIRRAAGRASDRMKSYLTIMVTWLLFRFLLTGLNKVECYNREALLDAVLDRGDRGLLTVSNHMCIYDDPGLWSALVPFWRTGQKKMRWAMCTDDVYGANRHLRGILDAGKTLPIKRSRGMEQPLFKVFFDKLRQGEWGHIFAEGGVRQPWRFSRGEPILADFKAGIGRLLLRSEDLPIVIPMYHIGMHQIAPETPVHKRGRGTLSKALPNVGRKIRVYVGEPIDVSPIVNKCRENIGDVRDLPWTDRSSREEIECHKEIAAFVRDHVLKLEAMARRDYYGSDPNLSPYSTGE